MGGSRLPLHAGNNDKNPYFDTNGGYCWPGDSEIEFNCSDPKNPDSAGQSSDGSFIGANADFVDRDKVRFDRVIGSDQARLSWKGNCRRGELVPDGAQMERNNG